MWLFHPTGFVSIVAATDPLCLLVRGRFSHDVECLFPGVVVETTPEKDYRFRAVVPREAVAKRVAELAAAISYDNFKNAAPADRCGVYSAVWTAMYTEQERRTPVNRFQHNDEMFEDLLQRTKIKRKKKENRPRYACLGAVSEGTMNPRDLIETYRDVLGDALLHFRLTRDQRLQFRKLVMLADEYEIDALSEMRTTSIDPSDLLQDLEDALGELAPPYARFGTHEGDGALFGYWPSEEADELPSFPDVGLAPRGQDVRIVSDHGNMSVGRVDRNGKWHEYWSTV